MAEKTKKSHICDNIDPKIVEWMKSFGFEWTNRMGDGIMSNHKNFVSKEKGVVQPEHAELFYQAAQVNGDTSDGWHTFDELYEYRMLYNAGFFNLLPIDKFKVHKSWRHSDGQLCFGKENYFVVVAQLPTGQISNHYHGKHWDLFDIPERPTADEWDGHTPEDVAKRLRAYLEQTA